MNTIEMPKVGISGKVLQWEVINADGSIDQSCYRPSDNVITDVGLEQLATLIYDYSPSYYFCIGTGTATPSATDTTLTAETYRSTCAYATYDSFTKSVVNSDPYYIYIQRGVQTILGSLNGTYGEIGFSPIATSNANVFSKHRLKDENGDPTTITVSSAQQLRLKYVLIFCFSPSTVTTGTINISGIGDINYEAKWQDTPQNSACLFTLFTNYNIQYSGITFRNNISEITLYDIGTPLNLTGTAQTSKTTSYVSNSHNRLFTCTWSVDVANVTWYGVTLGNATYGDPHFVVKFATPITKVNTHMMSFTIKVSWGRA